MGDSLNLHLLFWGHAFFFFGAEMLFFLFLFDFLFFYFVFQKKIKKNKKFVPILTKSGVVLN